MMYIWTKLFIELILLVYLFSIFNLIKKKDLYYFIFITIIYLVRDIIFIIITNNNVIIISDIIVISIYLMWTRRFTGKVKYDLIYYLFNIIIIISGITQIIFNIIYLNYYIFSIFLMIDIFYLLSVMLKITEYNTEHADIIINIRYKIFSVYFISYILMGVIEFNIYVTNNIILPLSYLLLFYLCYKFQNQINEENKNIIYNYSNDLNSLFNFMNNFGNAIKNKLDLNKALEIIVESAVENTNADAGAILLVDEYENNLKVKAVSGLFPPLYPVQDIVKVRSSSLKSYFISTPINIGETILGESVKEGKSFFIKDISGEERLKNNQEDNLLYISSIIVIPLVVSKRVIGVLSTIKNNKNRQFNERDFNHLNTFASYVSISIDNMFTYLELLEKNELQKELMIAAQIQKRLIPTVLPDISNLSMAVYSKPAKGVSGDYYDIVKLDEDKFGIVICDVAGKGVPAAMVMIMIRTILHLIIFEKKEPAHIMNWINFGLCGNVEADIFATMSIIILDYKSYEVIYSNAAHMPLLLFKKDINKFLKVDTNGLPLGIEKKSVFAQKRFNIDNGDILILYTDGIIEAMNNDGKQYSIEKLLKKIKEKIDLSAEDLVTNIVKDIDEFVGNRKQHDDQTLLVIKSK